MQRLIPPTIGVGVVGLTSYYVNNQMQNMTSKYPFIQEALLLVPNRSLQIQWFKTVHVDEQNNVGYATVYLKEDGSPVRITVNRRSRGLNSNAPSNDILSPYEDLYTEGSGIAFYWENPWEIKASILRGVRNVVHRIKKIKYEYIGGISPDTDATVEVAPSWELTSVVLGEQLLLGDSSHSHPDLASSFLEKSSNTMNASTRRKTTEVVLLGMASTAVFMGCRRAWLNYRMWPGYTFARDFITSHPAVKQFYGENSVEIISRTGEFSRNTINAELTIKAGGVMDSLESAIKIEAKLPAVGATNNWIISHATMTPPGCDKKPIDLLVG